MASNGRPAPTLAATTNARTTAERLLDSCNWYTGRPTIMDSRVRASVFKSLQRSLGAWLPCDRATPILDIGCGEGNLLCFLQELGYTNLTGFDLSPQNVAICRNLGLDFVEQADALKLSCIPGLGRYGLIFAIDVLEHLPKQRAACFLVDVRSLLLPGGCAVIQTLNLGSHLGWFHLHSDLTHEFGLTEISAMSLLLAAGFSADRIELRPAWSATTPAGYLREAYMLLLHRLTWLADGAGRPKTATRDLLIRAIG